jgi:putative membrane protein
MKTTVVIAGMFLASVSILAAAATDQDFVTKAAQGGMAEVELGKLAADRGATVGVKQFGQQMVDDHGKANEELKSVASKAGATIPSSPSTAQEATANKLKQKNGDGFDKAYGDAMVKDHKETIALFEKEASSGKDADLKAFAAKTLPTLKSHLAMAEKLPQ